MKPFISVYLTGLLCLGLLYDVVSMQPQILNSFITHSYLSKQVTHALWRRDVEENFLRSTGEIGKWNVSDSNTTCILMKGIIKLTVNYTDFSNNTKLATLDVPPSATASGSCNEQYIMLSWLEEVNTTQVLDLKNTLTFTFTANNKSKDAGTIADGVPAGKFAIVKIAAVIHKNDKTFPNATNPSDPLTITREGLATFPTTLNRSFACDAITTIGSPTDQLTVLLQSSQIQAFRRVAKGQSDNGSFNAAEHCSADEISSGSVVVTVILSILCIVLLALAAAVIVTYVLKKRRGSVGSGYETM